MTGRDPGADALVSPRRWPWVVLAALLTVVAVGGIMYADSAAAVPDEYQPSVIEMVLDAGLITFAVVGALILTRFPRHPIGWLLLGAGAWECLAALAVGYGAEALWRRPELPGEEVAFWAPSTFWVPTILFPAVFIPLLFPDGRLPGPRWRPWAWAAGTAIALLSLGFMFADGPNMDFPQLDNPFGIPGFGSLRFLTPLVPVVLALGLAGVAVRRRRTSGDQREQLRWLIYVLALLTAGFLAAGFAGPWGPLPAVLILGPFLLVPVAVGAAVLKYRLYDIDIVINRTLAYGGLTVVILAGYGVFVIVAGHVFGMSVDWRRSVLVTAGLALAAYPILGWLQRGANRLMYGDRDAPYAAMARLAHRLADTVSPSRLLPTLAETIATALRLPYVGIELVQPTELRRSDEPSAASASYGTLRGSAYRLPLVHQGEVVGNLVLAPRSPGAALSAADLRLLDDVARQVAVAVHAVRLTDDLQRSRERLVLAREEERRRLRRDLHDGLGSALAGLALEAGNTRNAIKSDPERAEATLARIEAGIKNAIVNIRRLVYDLRPPALDELGLVGALRQQTTLVSPAHLEVKVPEPLPALPAAIEVAAYRIVTEALLNSARHASATTCTVVLRNQQDPEAFVIEIADDGHGLPAGYRAGVGMLSMRERATELGGTCAVEAGSSGGTVVRAVLPLATRVPSRPGPGRATLPATDLERTGAGTDRAGAGTDLVPAGDGLERE